MLNLQMINKELTDLLFNLYPTKLKINLIFFKFKYHFLIIEAHIFNI